MRRSGTRRTKRCFLLVALVFLAGAIAATRFFGIHGKQDFIAYYGIWKECHPTWKVLAMRRLRANQSVDEVQRIAPPLHSRTWDRYTLLAYGDMCDFTGLAILACDNKLVWAQATSCTWRHEFFRTITTNELAHIVQSYWALLVSDHQAKKKKADEGNSSNRSDAGQSE